MLYLVREKIFSFGDNFTISNVNGEDVFKVVGQVFSMGNKLRLYSLDDRELVYIEQKLFKFLPEYHLYINGDLAAVVKKKMSFFTQKLLIESSFGSFDVEGNILAHDFQVCRNGVIVANIYKKMFSFSDTYEVDIDDFEDQAFMLALVIAIDQIFHDDKNR